jgi:hypothetical protein
VKGKKRLNVLAPKKKAEAYRLAQPTRLGMFKLFFFYGVNGGPWFFEKIKYDTSFTLLVSSRVKSVLHLKLEFNHCLFKKTL